MQRPFQEHDQSLVREARRRVAAKLEEKNVDGFYIDDTETETGNVIFVSGLPAYFDVGSLISVVKDAIGTRHVGFHLGDNSSDTYQGKPGIRISIPSTQSFALTQRQTWLVFCLFLAVLVQVAALAELFLIHAQEEGGQHQH